MIKREASPQAAVPLLTGRSVNDEMYATSRSDWSDKNGLASGRKNRCKAVFAFVSL